MFKLNNATQGEPVMSCDELVNCVHSSSMSVCLCLCSCLYTFRCMVLMMHRRLKCCRCRWVGNFTASIDILHCMVLTDFTVQEPSKGHLMHCISIKVRWRGYDCCRTIARSCVCVCDCPVLLSQCLAIQKLFISGTIQALAGFIFDCLTVACCVTMFLLCTVAAVRPARHVATSWQRDRCWR